MYSPKPFGCRRETFHQREGVNDAYGHTGHSNAAITGIGSNKALRT